ncbi:leucine--tRNA ligase [Striga asiatica]|uniref:Leucine--tRNA ligase n=1 Tax=Striga asiatica TaxID=4170 RepID=A0A5A7RGX9_STRAF|nr:leucine--tRNA ligase [Striga asiatica]
MFVKEAAINEHQVNTRAVRLLKLTARQAIADRLQIVSLHWLLSRHCLMTPIVSREWLSACKSIMRPAISLSMVKSFPGRNIDLRAGSHSRDTIGVTSQCLDKSQCSETICNLISNRLAGSQLQIWVRTRIMVTLGDGAANDK